MQRTRQSIAGTTIAIALGISGLITACGGQDSNGMSQSEEEAPPAAEIAQPVDQAILDGPDVLVQLSVSGIALAPAGVDSANTGHLHLFVNHDLTPEGEVIPTGEGIIHMGSAQSEHMLEGLEPGEYTVIAVLGDFLHVRIPGSRTDTVHFTIR
jgi:hypothetical protein